MKFSLTVESAAYATGEDIAEAMRTGAIVAAALLRNPGPFPITRSIVVTPPQAASSIKQVVLTREE